MAKGKAMQKQWKLERKRARANRAANRKVTEVTVKKNFDQRKVEKKAILDTQEREKELNEGRRQRRIIAEKKRIAKKKRQEENEIRNGKYQVIKKTEKIRSWNKKARLKLMKMSPEQISSLIEKNA